MRGVIQLTRVEIYESPKFFFTPWYFFFWPNSEQIQYIESITKNYHRSLFWRQCELPWEIYQRFRLSWYDLH